MDTIGGAQIHVRDITNFLKNKGYEVQMITGSMGSVHHAFENIPIHTSHHLVRELNPFLDIKAYFEIRRFLKTIKPDLVATHSSKAGFIGRLAATSLRIPVIFTAHGWSFTEGVVHSRKFFYRWIEKLAGYFSSGIIAVSEYDRRLAINRKVIRENKIICIQNGVHPVGKLQKTEEKSGPIQLIMIARFAPPKMQLQLLACLTKLAHLDWVMNFVGDGPEKGKAEQFVIENCLSHKVHFAGWRQNVDDMLAKSDIFILLSQYEGLPLSILEAMRAGLPVIATDVGGVKEAVSSENGILVGVDDSSALTEALESMIGSRELQKNKGAHSRKLFEEKFTFNRMIEETLSYYRVIAGKDD